MNEYQLHLYYWTRAMFFVMISFTFLIPAVIDMNDSLYVLLSMGSMVSTISYSILHLIKIKKPKAFAIFSLVVSCIMFILAAWLFTAGFVYGMVKGGI